MCRKGCALKCTSPSQAAPTTATWLCVPCVPASAAITRVDREEQSQTTESHERRTMKARAAR